VWGIGFDPYFCWNIAGWLKCLILNAWSGFWTYFSYPPLLCCGGDRFPLIYLLKYRRVAKMLNIERWGGFWTYLSNPPLLCWYGVRGFVSDPIFVEMLQGDYTDQYWTLGADFERIFQIHPYYVSMVWRDRFRPLFLLKYRRVAKMSNF